MSNKIRLLTIALGVTALAGVTYGVARRGLQRRAAPPLESHALAANELSEPPSDELSLSDWETLTVHATRGSMPDALDVALNLDGIFDGQPDGEAVTARPSDRVPAPFAGADQEAPNADDLGLAWLIQATEAERSIGENDLTPELENLALNDQDESEEADEAESDPLDGTDEHEDFRRTRA